MPPESWISISVVVPVYSGENFLHELIQQLDRVRTEWVEKQAPMRLAELILIDDAAIDASATIVNDLEASHAWVTALHLMRNFGQHAATIAGVLHSSGDWVVTIDEDLQHPPAAIEYCSGRQRCPAPTLSTHGQAALSMRRGRETGPLAASNT